ncbi:MAG: carbamoyl-phosphate synthase large subunit [Planctomycetes bacterium]|nr:carbamoyl-phosphate synthase large subunit [Planctomycetota bacterium]
MPKRTDIEKILLIGSGPIVIGQACEFDYSGAQACKALIEEGYQVTLLNSNPATIMTDPVMAHRTYIEPITAGVLAKVIERERPDALLATLGGQTALNVAVQASEAGVLDRFAVEMIGANETAIKCAEDRRKFRAALEEIGVEMPRSRAVYSVQEAREAAREIGFPLIIRPSFTLGGTGASVAYNVGEFQTAAARGLDASMIGEALIEESVIGWKEYELEVMRDRKDNVVIICSIENIDAMGVHTGDSVTVAPAQTLTDKQYQNMRDAALAIIRKVGVETGGSNIQFAVHPDTGRMVAIEMNPRVSRSSALASKATGFPIAKIAAKLAVGYTLDEIPNDITRETPACFEPTIDYCVVKLPRFAFEKFPDADDTLTVSMKSVGEAMAIGRTFKEALQKGLRSLETGLSGLDRKCEAKVVPEDLLPMLARPNPLRLFYVKHALKNNMPIQQIADLTRIDPWFLNNIRQIVEMERELGSLSPEELLSEEFLRKAKRTGFSDRQIADLGGMDPAKVRRRRTDVAVRPVYRLVDTCAAEFEAYTPYFYSTYESEDEARPGARERVVIIGSGPNRIGQGIEFDYCCVHAALAAREDGYDSIMINSNPETVSTDYDTANRLYFEPLTAEDVLNIVEAEKPYGVILQFGGQTPLNISAELEANGVPLLGTSPRSIDLAEDREHFSQILRELGLKQAPSGIATTYEAALQLARRIGYPVLVRPSYVLGGRAMEIVYDAQELKRFMREALKASPEGSVLVDKFLEDAIEVDVDAISDGHRTVIGAIMEHIEQAGVHSGDSACVIPPQTLSRQLQDEIARQTRELSSALDIVGLMNIQFAVQQGEVYVLELNPRASRTIPFVSKATGVPLARLATKVMLGRSLEELGLTEEVRIKHVAVKEAVFPFTRFTGIDTQLGPEMKSTGEVMGIADDFGMAFAKAQLAAGQDLLKEGAVFFSLCQRDKTSLSAGVARKFSQMGFELVATEGTAAFLRASDIPCQRINKVREGRPHVVDAMINGEIGLVINTPSGKNPRQDEIAIRSTAWARRVPIITTIQGAVAAAEAIAGLKEHYLTVKTLQEYIIETHGEAPTPHGARV